MPLSLAKAYTAREVDVRQDSPQNHMAMEASAAMAFPILAPNACCITAIAGGIAFPPTSFACSTSGRLRIARVKARINAYPTTPDTATESIMPHGALVRGFSVSSAM